jgi:hypothetical protein
MSDEKKPEPPGGWPGMVRSAVRNAPASDPAIGNGAAWSELLTDLERAGRLVLGEAAPENDLDRAEGWRHLASLLRLGISEMLVSVDPDRPRFEWNDGTAKWGLDCADALYAQAAVRAGAVYRVRGRRGSVHFVGLQLIARMRAVADLDADDLEIDANGRFELQLGGEKPERGSWLSLPEDATALIVRQFFYDWDNEVPAALEVERIDDGPRRTLQPASPGAIAAQLRALGRFVHDNTAWWARIAAAKRDDYVNTFPDDAGGLGQVASASQKYQSFGIGYFCLAADEALLIEVTPPAAKYWSLHLGNHWMESLDFANHQTSLNGYQSVLDSDGMFRAVVSPRDPGIANWLDPAGHAEGAMIYRWNQADGAPVPRTRVVKFADIRAALPAGTATVSPEERQAAIERRREHVRRRYARSL